jgi:drug/metabolite transporter (DMT)-like permease
MLTPTPAWLQGYSKTLVIVAGAALWFQEAMSMGKALGVGLAIAGLAWYSSAKLQEAKKG